MINSESGLIDEARKVAAKIDQEELTWDVVIK